MSEQAHQVSREHVYEQAEGFVKQQRSLEANRITLEQEHIQETDRANSMLRVGQLVSGSQFEVVDILKEQGEDFLADEVDQARNARNEASSNFREAAGSESSTKQWNKRYVDAALPSWVEAAKADAEAHGVPINLEQTQAAPVAPALSHL